MDGIDQIFTLFLSADGLGRSGGVWRALKGNTELGSNGHTRDAFSKLLHSQPALFPLYVLFLCFTGYYFLNCLQDHIVYNTLTLVGNIIHYIGCNGCTNIIH